VRESGSEVGEADGTAERACYPMKVLDRKLLRELLASKGLILAITSLMAVGVMAFVYMRSAYANLNRAKDDYYCQCRMADFWIDVKKAPLSELEALAELPGVSEVRPRIQFYATVDLERVEEPLNGMVLSVPDKQYFEDRPGTGGQSPTVLGTRSSTI
jgi:putative ABC transport system permease protein